MLRRRSGTPLKIVGSAARRDHSPCVRVDVDSCTGDDDAEVERTGQRMDRDREPVGRPAVGAGKEDWAGERVRIACTDVGRRRADLAGRRARAGICLRFAAQPDRRDRADQPAGQDSRERRQVLLSVRAREVERKCGRAERARRSAGWSAVA